MKRGFASWGCHSATASTLLQEMMDQAQTFGIRIGPGFDDQLIHGSR
jgi:hypothetical protein